MATPQCAVAQSGSLAIRSRKVFFAADYANECNSATARSNSFCAGRARRRELHDAELLGGGMLMCLRGCERFPVSQCEPHEAETQHQGDSQISNCNEAHYHASHRINLSVSC